MDGIGLKLADRVAVLKSKCWEELIHFPEHLQEELSIDNHLALQSIWIDRVSDETIRVVVQIYLPKVLGIGRMQASGFRKCRSEESTDLSADELAEFS